MQNSRHLQRRRWFYIKTAHDIRIILVVELRSDLGFECAITEVLRLFSLHKFNTSIKSIFEPSLYPVGIFDFPKRSPIPVILNHQYDIRVCGLFTGGHFTGRLFTGD